MATTAITPPVGTPTLAPAAASAPTSGPVFSALGVGSGLDLNGLLDSLQQNENQQLTPIANRQASYQAKISAYGSLQGALSSLQAAMQALSDPATFQAVAGTVVGGGLTAATTSATPPGDYQIQVAQLAQASSVATQGVTDDTANLGAGAITFTLADGTSTTVAVDAANSSLDAIRDAINRQPGGVRASPVNDGSGQPWRLVLQATQTGSAAAVASVAFEGDLGSALALDPATRQAGQDAELSINGIAVQSAGNTVQGAIQGTTLNLTGTGSAVLQVAPDVDAVTRAVQGFVTAYNQLSGTIGQLTSYDAGTQTAGTLLGDSAVRAVQSQLGGILNGVVSSGGAFRTLGDLGITLQLDGTYAVDDNKLQQAVSGHLGDVAQFFTGGTATNGLADQVQNLVTGMNASTGLIGNAIASINQSLSRLADEYTNTQQRIAQTMATYKQQFSQLDALVAQMNSTSTYLTQQFAALSKLSSGNQ